jgi:hypothetical protein
VFYIVVVVVEVVIVSVQKAIFIDESVHFDAFTPPNFGRKMVLVLVLAKTFRKNMLLLLMGVALNHYYKSYTKFMLYVIKITLHFCRNFLVKTNE